MVTDRPGMQSQSAGFADRCVEAMEALEDATDKYLSVLERSEFCEDDDAWGDTLDDLQSWVELCSLVGFETSEAAEALQAAWMEAVQACPWLSF